ncbi:uncharacterized protein [Montipora foliosa]|uniref:uncharacterized protein n=1 Tax=Montipora foliosa TaxID=591990 RepID=UPI0035F170A6
MAKVDKVDHVMLEFMADVLSSQPESRTSEIILKILPILRNKSPLFYNLRKDVLVDIAKNALLRKVKRDHAIVWQGQEGKSFGIILKGFASVHARKEQAGLQHQDSTPIPRLHKDRNLLIGPQLSLLTTGCSFGEMAMTSHSHRRYNTTIVAEEITYVLLFDGELYGRSFAGYQTEWQKKVEFVDQSPLFQKMTPVLKNLLIDNLKSLELHFGNRFVKQGDACNSLFFVSLGWGKVIADTRLSRTQYDKMKQMAMTKYKTSGRQTALFGREQQKENFLDPSRPLSVIERRRLRRDHGYVAVETLLRHRESQVTTTGPNDVIGDIELVLNLPTYCASVECLENLQVYELSKNNFHQIIAQRSPKTYSEIKQGVLSKLHFRSQRLQEIPLYTLLYENAQSLSKEGKKQRPTITVVQKEFVELRKPKKEVKHSKQIKSRTPPSVEHQGKAIGLR